MKSYLLLLVSSVCLATLIIHANEERNKDSKTEDVKSISKTAPVDPTIIVPAEMTELAKIDRNTLKVTYAKGADPKKVVDQIVKAWAEAMKNLSACQVKIQELEKNR